jgi:cob(I)alamin adenosyltransferase
MASMPRCITRRAERRVCTLARAEPVRAELLAYLNRLSDLLFVLARILARDAGSGEVLWQPGGESRPS